uniref:Uncharacterized protein n=1 Tax=Arundo donax TaxID=35708 RepID=A0A0A9ETL5_ARUDO
MLEHTHQIPENYSWSCSPCFQRKTSKNSIDMMILHSKVLKAEERNQPKLNDGLKYIWILTSLS